MKEYKIEIDLMQDTFSIEANSLEEAKQLAYEYVRDNGEVLIVINDTYEEWNNE